MNRHKGFTLIELLVVIAIIAILAAILFPVFAKAREKAKQSTCMSHLKQIALAVHQYCSDYDDYGPSRTEPTNWWCMKLGPYGCPMQLDKGRRNPLWECNSGAYSSSYSMHSNMAGSYQANSGLMWRLGESSNPSGDMLVGENCWQSATAGNGFYSGYGTYAQMREPKGYISGWTYYPIDTAHNGGNHIAFFDGHAKWVSLGTFDDEWALFSDFRTPL